MGVAAVLLGFRIQFLKLITFRLDCWKTDPFFLYLDLLEMMLGQTRFLKHIPPHMVIHSGGMFSYKQIASTNPSLAYFWVQLLAVRFRSGYMTLEIPHAPSDHQDMSSHVFRQGSIFH